MYRTRLKYDKLGNLERLTADQRTVSCDRQL